VLSHRGRHGVVRRPGRSSERERAFKRALELSPGSADAHDGYAHVLQAHGRDDETLV
jgi:hypothetical protein